MGYRAARLLLESLAGSPGSSDATIVLRPQLVDEKDPTKFRPGANTIVAVDSLGAGIGELVLFCQGSSARLAGGDVVAIAGNVNVLPYYLVSHPSIKRHEELRGKIGGTHIAGTTAESFDMPVSMPRS